ncbi:FmdB family zinc ribbon protein [Ammonifex thiophilus]|uniref:Zinc ribbon domain-containing protein n=1 Tax=Ammonifex thiophilus TaxID=444093 RepID=A0A3D8P2Y1_9THEO|nr:zinc ribbon domain-containing protein [Ammonifex thiophilus]RDV82921.1 zinc ribbon domain-containing protein [Ammonifex thiophilus]
MPIYEFRCQACGYRFERLCPMGETGENLTCPACGAKAPLRVMSAFTTKGVESGSGSSCSSCTSTSCSTCSLK